MLIKKFHIHTHLMLDYNFIVKEKNSNIYIVGQLVTLHSFMRIVAFHLGAIDEPHGGCDVGAEPEDGEWWTRLEGWMDPDVHDWRKMLAKRVSSN